MCNQTPYKSTHAAPAQAKHCKVSLEAGAAPAGQVAAVQLPRRWQHCLHGLQPVVDLHADTSPSQHYWLGDALDITPHLALQAGRNESQLDSGCGQKDG